MFGSASKPEDAKKLPAVRKALGLDESADLNAVRTAFEAVLSAAAASAQGTTKARALALGCSPREASMLEELRVDPAAYVANKQRMQANRDDGKPR